MEELTEVITASEFHPTSCNLFVYSSSKGTVRLCDMREAALCDKHAKCKKFKHLIMIFVFKVHFEYTCLLFLKCSMSRKIQQTEVSSPKLSPVYLMLSSPTLVGIWFQETTCRLKYGIFIWNPGQLSVTL